MTATGNSDYVEGARAIFLDVDWTILRPAATAIELWMASLENREPVRLPVRSRESPITVQLPHHDKPVTFYRRPAVISALRALPNDVHLYWLTSWMTNLGRLDELQHALGLPAERIRPAPLPPEVGPGRYGFPNSMRVTQHWKFQTVAHYLRIHPGAEALWLDDEAGHYTHHVLAPELQPRLHYLRPTPWNHLLTEADAATIRRWATRELPALRQDRTDLSYYTPNGGGE